MKFTNKFSRLKQLIQSEQARKNLSDSDVQNLENRVLSGHDRGFANQDIDMLSMAQRMAKGTGKGATAFDAEHLQMGDLQGLLPGFGSPAPKKKGGNPDADEDSLVLGRFVVSEQGRWTHFADALFLFIIRHVASLLVPNALNLSLNLLNPVNP